MKRRRLCVRPALGLILTLIAGPALAELAGTASVIDGDTLTIQGQRIRLHGIDAPETGQTCLRNGAPWECGKAAADLLHELTEGTRVICEEKSKIGPGLVEAKCKAGWLDLGAEMVTRGMAVPVPGPSTDYVRNHREARGKGNGIFAGEFVAPWDWRRGKRLMSAETGSCSVCDRRHKSFLDRRKKQDDPAPGQ